MKKITVSQLQPLPGYVLVQPAQSETKTASGIILPESNSEKPQYGTVLALGAVLGDDSCGGCCEMECCSDESCKECCGGSCESCECDDKECKDGECCTDESCEGCCSDEDCEPGISVGDTVVYKKWGGNDVVIDDVEYQFLKYEDILAVVTKE